MSDGYARYIEQVQRLLSEALDETHLRAIEHVAVLAADRIMDGRVIYVFGASHAGLLAQDLFYRAGGLVPIQPLLPRDLMLDTRPVTATSTTEQSPGKAREFLAESSLGTGDLLLVISVSGRNAVPVEMCMLARERGATVVAVTSLAYSRAVTGRQVPRLFEVADLVIDIPGVIGDAVIDLGHGLPAVGPTSSPVGAAILQGLMVEVEHVLAARGVVPPVFASANLDTTDAWNTAQIERWRDRVDYL